MYDGNVDEQMLINKNAGYNTWAQWVDLILKRRVEKAKL
jgi:hypothetical protein